MQSIIIVKLNQQHVPYILYHAELMIFKLGI